LKNPLRLKFLDANKPSAVEATDLLPGISNYFIGNDRSKWRTEIPHYAKLRLRGIYPGIDMVYYSGEKRLEYDFVLSPGADPSRIALAWEGTERIRVDETGDLVLTTSAGDFRQKRPVVYQEIRGQKVMVAASYRLDQQNRVSFDLGAWDSQYALVIDPVLFY